MENFNKNFICSSLLSLLTFLSMNVRAEEFAVISVQGCRVYWAIDSDISYSSAELRVSAPEPDGNVYTELFDYPIDPSYPSKDTVLIDGIYHYELVLNPHELVLNPQLAAPAPDVRKSDGSGVDANGRPTSAYRNRSGDVLPEAPMQSGSFFIQDCALVSPDVEE